jgi:hypothetical protein
LAEAQSKNWLASSWRPVTMLIFVGLIVARWFGWTAPGLSEPEVLELWAIVKIGMSGYVIGRSVEKVVPDVVAAMKSKLVVMVLDFRTGRAKRWRATPATKVCFGPGNLLFNTSCLGPTCANTSRS